MAEVLGVVAGGIGIVSLAIQIVENLNKVIRFCESIKEAPTDIQRIIKELQLLSDIMSTLQLVHGKRRGTGQAMTKNCLDLVTHDISKLSDLSSYLEQRLNSNKIITRTWARVRTVFSEKKIAMLRDHLESATSRLQLLQSCHMFEKLEALNSQTPKSLGNPWETGELADHVKIDDGLETFVLPLDLCRTWEVFISTLTLKYESNKLPGLLQIQRRHLVAWDWSGTIQINLDNWGSIVKGGRGIKLGYIMSTWHGFPQGKCIRCFKPRKQNTRGQKWLKCSSCALEFYMVEPDAIKFETTDMRIGFSPDQYRDYRLASRKKKPTNRNSDPTVKQETTPASTRGITYNNPPIDFVCRRLIVKWEPTFNIVHRYLHCRCVIRLSTPSHIELEMNIFVVALCPRHNTLGVNHQDYGNIDYHQDQYFKKFGGYRSFQGFIYGHHPNIYKRLGGEKFLSNEHIEDALKVWKKSREGNEEGLDKVAYQYFFEINDELEKIGVELPDRIAANIKDERLRRRNEEAATDKEREFGYFNDFSLNEEQRRQVSEIPMIREVRDILGGKWLGKPHWAIEY